MKIIQIRSTINIALIKSGFHLKEGIYSNNIILENGAHVETSIDFANGSIRISCVEYPVEEQFLDNIDLYRIKLADFRKRSESGEKVDFNVLYNELDESTKIGIKQIKNSLIKHAKDALTCIKYFYSNYGIAANLITDFSTEWQINDKEWENIPGTIICGGIDSASLTPLEGINNWIKQTINSGIQPLIGQKFLHQAKNESDAVYKWISATIALELSIKEILIRKEPITETILLECPSPPLTKLYGPIMEEYLGERTPFSKLIRKGVEIRNILMHRPETDLITLQEAIDYVRGAEKAIFHALYLLYPDDPSIKWAWTKASLGDEKKC